MYCWNPDVLTSSPQTLDLSQTEVSKKVLWKNRKMQITISRAKKRTLTINSFLKNGIVLAINGKLLGFFPLLPGKPMPGFGTPRIRGSIPAVTPSSCGPESSIGWRSKRPTAWGEHVWRTWWRDLASNTGAALVVILCGFEDKHLQVNQHEASESSSIFKLVIMEEICWKGLSLLLIHGLSWTITDGLRFEVLTNTSWIMIPFQYFPVVIQEPFWKAFTTWLQNSSHKKFDY